MLKILFFISKTPLEFFIYIKGRGKKISLPQPVFFSAIYHNLCAFLMQQQKPTEESSERAKNTAPCKMRYETVSEQVLWLAPYGPIGPRQYILPSQFPNDRLLADGYIVFSVHTPAVLRWGLSPHSLFTSQARFLGLGRHSV